jgi:hypothetical protein
MSERREDKEVPFDNGDGRMKTLSQRMAEIEVEIAERTKGKTFLQKAYEMYALGGFQPQRPLAEVVPFPDRRGANRARFAAWEMARRDEAQNIAWRKAQEQANG